MRLKILVVSGFIFLGLHTHTALQVIVYVCGRFLPGELEIKEMKGSLLNAHFSNIHYRAHDYHIHINDVLFQFHMWNLLHPFQKVVFKNACINFLKTDLHTREVYIKESVYQLQRWKRLCKNIVLDHLSIYRNADHVHIHGVLNDRSYLEWHAYVEDFFLFSHQISGAFSGNMDQKKPNFWSIHIDSDVIEAQHGSRDLFAYVQGVQVDVGVSTHRGIQDVYIHVHNGQLPYLGNCQDLVVKVDTLQQKLVVYWGDQIVESTYQIQEDGVYCFMKGRNLPIIKDGYRYIGSSDNIQLYMNAQAVKIVGDVDVSSIQKIQQGFFMQLDPDVSQQKSLSLDLILRLYFNNCHVQDDSLDITVDGALDMRITDIAVHLKGNLCPKKGWYSFFVHDLCIQDGSQLIFLDKSMDMRLELQTKKNIWKFDTDPPRFNHIPVHLYIQGFNANFNAFLSSSKILTETFNLLTVPYSIFDLWNYMCTTPWKIDTQRMDVLVFLDEKKFPVLLGFFQGRFMLYYRDSDYYGFSVPLTNHLSVGIDPMFSLVMPVNGVNTHAISFLSTCIHQFLLDALGHNLASLLGK